MAGKRGGSKKKAETGVETRGRKKVLVTGVRLLPVRLEPEDYDALKRLADEKGQTMAVYVRRLIFESFGKNDIVPAERRSPRLH